MSAACTTTLVKLPQSGCQGTHTQGAIPMGETEWEHARIMSGRPRASQELTEDHTPLEAGLWDVVDLGKGCYIGQETLAKVSNLGALNRELWGIQLHGAAQSGDTVTAGLYQ